MAVPKYVVLAMAVVALATAASAKTVAVGGAQQWTYGFDYPSWASKIRFSVGDALVFKYSPSGIPHNVYLLKGKTQYLNCDFKGAVLLAGTSAGSPGFKYVLKQKKTYYFACGIGNGSHCKNGSMKFAATPR